MEHMIIHNARYLRLPNRYGIKKIMRNISALQQSVKTLSGYRQDVDLERAKQYYSLFSLTPLVRLTSLYLPSSLTVPF
jgi:exocyst complex component 4